MRQLALRLTTTSPLAIRADHAPGGANGTRYIPGSTLLGALTVLYRQFYQGDQQRIALFEPLFLQEQVFYPNLYPATFADAGLQGQPSPVYPLPRTAQCCKRHKGLRFPEDGKNEAHGARDTLIDGALLRLATSDEQRLAILRAGKNCRCQEPMDHFEGYYRRNQLNPVQMVAARPESYSHLQTRTGIHRKSGTVQDGVLYNRQVFEEGMEFWGEALFPTDDDGRLLAEFNRFLDETGRTGFLRLGTGRTRGMGRVTLVAEEPDDDDDRDQDPLAAFTSRLERFDATLRQRASDFHLGPLPYAFFFALTLHAPMILYDALLRYRGVIDAEALAELLDSRSIPGLALIYHAASTRRVTGWQDVWGTPRAAEIALDSGSTFLFGCAAPPDTALLAALFKLEREGAGKKRAEGFGRLNISDLFHQQVHQEEGVV